MSDVQVLRGGAEATTEKFTDWGTTFSELAVKHHLTTEEAWCGGDLQRHLDAKVGDLKLTKRALESEEDAFKDKSWGKGLLDVEVITGWAQVKRRERVVHDFEERV